MKWDENNKMVKIGKLEIIGTRLGSNIAFAYGPNLGRSNYFN